MTTYESKATLTPAELNIGEALIYIRREGIPVMFRLVDTDAEIMRDDEDAHMVYRFWCVIDINGKKHTLEREVPTQKTFYEPWVIDGVRVFFDAVSNIFVPDGGFMLEKDERHGIYCQPGKKARFALQDADVSICPERMHLWCRLPEGELNIKDCYRGENCWMGTYNRREAHGGLDINHPACTPLYAPFDLDDQFYFNSVAAGDNNNRWRGLRNWDDGTTWIIQAHHMTALTVPEHTPLKAGTQFALGAGVWSGCTDHSHFVFKVVQHAKMYLLDPWILFWQMLRDQ